MMTEEDIFRGKMAGERPMTETEIIRIRYINKVEGATQKASKKKTVQLINEKCTVAKSYSKTVYQRDHLFSIVHRIG